MVRGAFDYLARLHVDDPSRYALLDKIVNVLLLLFAVLRPYK